MCVASITIFSFILFAGLTDFWISKLTDRYVCGSSIRCSLSDRMKAFLLLLLHPTKKEEWLGPIFANTSDNTLAVPRCVI